MKPETAFDTHQSEVNAEPDNVREARRRRNFFCAAFGAQADVTETVPSGSLARGTQRDPIHDVDLIIVFSPEDHPDWDTGTEAPTSRWDTFGARWPVCSVLQPAASRRKSASPACVPTS